MAKLELNFKGMEAYLEQLRRLGANVEEETEKALIESCEIVSPFYCPLQRSLLRLSYFGIRSLQGRFNNRCRPLVWSAFFQV